ncbi:MAG TPA: acetyl-CoA hydrolase/transferase C-terminal domain-containing protein, partial [Dehalococcoidia bacterium]|nr:acetyl-CoA hydrolase/transferase C-terminal domain-containing protein [Dehalococcoidia bacterium]
MTTETRTTSDWQTHYRERLVSGPEAVSHVKSGDKIWISVGQQIHLLLASLVGRADELEGVEIKWLPSSDFGFYTEEMRRHLSINVTYATPFCREAVNNGIADYTPYPIIGAHKALDEGRPGARPIDVALVCVTPPNKWGYCCFGSNLWDAKTTAQRAQLVIAEVNERLPRTFGDTWIHASEIDWFVENTPPPPEGNWLYPEPDPWDRPIAEYVASLVRDGDTIQIGTGSTTGNIPRLGVLDDKKDLGYFAELTVPGTVDLVRKGVITSSRMTTHPGKFVTTTAGNSPEDLDFIDQNPMFEFYSVEYIHHPGNISKNDNLVAINNALTVDFTGQIAAMSYGTHTYSGTGGHISFAMGAYLSNGGRYICVLPATARGGTVTRIVPQFEPGQVVTVPRDMADYVVTEYGIATLLNKTQRERAQELIAIA